MHRSNSPISIAASALPRVVLLVAALAVAALCLPTGSVAQTAPGSTTADAGRVQFVVESGGAIDAVELLERFQDEVTAASGEFASLFAAQPAGTITITFAAAPDAATTATMRPVSDIAWASGDGASVIIALDPFLNLTPNEAVNVLRNATSRAYLHAASGGNLPVGLMDGIARYIERPLLARQARYGSLVQGAHQAGTLPDWPVIIEGGASSDLDDETMTAVRYALVAFVAERYGVADLQGLVRAFATTPDWRVAVPQVLGQPIEELTAAWNDFLPRWFGGGWRSNAVSAFDLAPAESLFERGAYEAAMSRAEPSLRLFTELEVQQRLARVEGLLAQSAVGIQAEALMIDVQAALEAHDYDRAATLLDQAESLYVVLPEEHRPSGTIATYRTMATDGVTARAQLLDAEERAGNWAAVKSARADAVDAGATFARLGDVERADAARELVTALDLRLRRLVLALSSIAVLVAAWFGVWTWARAPLRLNWGRA